MTPHRSDPARRRTARTESAFLPHVLRDYILIADGERGAVVGPHGDIIWLCAPRWESGSVFSALIGGHGAYTVSPDGPHVWGGYYEEASMIWRHRWTTRAGFIECRDTLAYPAEPDRIVLLRQIHAVDAPSSLTVVLEPRAGYDQQPLRELHRHRGIWTATAGALRLRWTGAADARARQNGTQLILEITLPAGGRHDLILELSEQPLPDEPPDPETCWAATEAAWNDNAPQFEETLAPRQTRQSYAVLRGLTSSSGGMVAAATTSLPERAEAGRNYDYRYVWIRDQCYAGLAGAAASDNRLLDDAVTFVTARLLDHGAQMAPAYTTHGARIPDQQHLELPGYPGGYDITGNWVNQQFQLDAFGEALQLIAAAARVDRIDSDQWKAAEAAAAAIDKRWTEPDAGIWEIEPDAWTHSRLTAAGGLRAISTVRPQSSSAADWIALADRITADTSSHALHRDGHWQRSPDRPALDASLLLIGLRGAIPADDPRTVTTLRAYLADLTADGYAYRYRHDNRPLGDAEGSFLLCGFLTALALHQQGRELEARAWYQRTRASTGPAELFSEEFDATENQMRGNLPQAFVHALMLEASVELARPAAGHASDAGGM